MFNPKILRLNHKFSTKIKNRRRADVLHSGQWIL